MSIFDDYPALQPFRGSYHVERILDVFPVFLVIDDFLNRTHPTIARTVTDAFVQAWRHELTAIQRGTVRRYWSIRFGPSDLERPDGPPLPAVIRDDRNAAVLIRVVEGKPDDELSYSPTTREFEVNADFALLDAENDLPILFALSFHGHLEHYQEIRAHLANAKEASHASL